MFTEESFQKTLLNMDLVNISDFFNQLPENEREVSLHLHNLILETLTDLKVKLSYGVPYYSKTKRICFVWPGSVKWGNVEKQGVALGFCYGNLIEDEIQFLERGGRNQVYTKTFKTSEGIQTELVRKYLLRALEVDDLHNFTTR